MTPRHPLASRIRVSLSPPLHRLLPAPKVCLPHSLPELESSQNCRGLPHSASTREHPQPTCRTGQTLNTSGDSGGWPENGFAHQPAICDLDQSRGFTAAAAANEAKRLRGKGAGAGPGGGDAADLSRAALGPALQGHIQLQEGGSAYRLNRKWRGLLKARVGTCRLSSVWLSDLMSVLGYAYLYSILKYQLKCLNKRIYKIIRIRKGNNLAL